MTETTADRLVDTPTPGTAVTTWLADFEKALTAGDIDAAAGQFVADCYWRDLVAFSWNIVTVEGHAGVRDLLGQTLKQVKPSGFAIAAELGEPAEAGGVTESWIRFETSAGRGLGHLRLRDDKAWTLLTTLDELKGHEEPKSDRRPRGTEHGAVPNRQTWLEQRRREAEDLGHVTQPYALIVGGGQGGIALGARLRQLGVPTIIVDRNPRPGDAWRKRYKSLCLHDPVWYDHLPYIDFPPNWPVFSPKDKIADWLEMYTRVMAAQLLGLDRVQERLLRRDGQGVDRCRRARRCRADAAPEAARACDRHVGQTESAQFRRHGRLHRRAAPFVQPSRTRWLQGQEGGRHRLEQLRP